jgi:hypothetical protein
MRCCGGSRHPAFARHCWNLLTLQRSIQQKRSRPAAAAAAAAYAQTKRQLASQRIPTQPPLRYLRHVTASHAAAAAALVLLVSGTQIQTMTAG